MFKINGYTGVFVLIIELALFLQCTKLIMEYSLNVLSRQDNSNMPTFTERCIHYGRTDGSTLIIEGLRFRHCY